MTILRVGTNEKYAEGWGRIFGTGTGKQKRTKKAGSKPAGKKSTAAVKSAPKSAVSARKSAASATKPAKKKAKK